MEYAITLIMLLGILCYVRHRLLLGRLIQYNMDMGPPDPDAIDYEQGFICFYCGKGRGGGATVLSTHAGM